MLKLMGKKIFTFYAEHFCLSKHVLILLKIEVNEMFSFLTASSDKFEVTVGENETCAASVQTSTKCNGQLPSSQDF